LHTGITAEAPGRKSDRVKMRLQMPRRYIDDQPPNLALADRFQLRGDDVENASPARIGCAGLSSWKQGCAKLAKSARSIASRTRSGYVPRPFSFYKRRLLRVLRFSTIRSAVEISPLRCPGQPLHILRRNHEISCCITSLSVGLNGDFPAGLLGSIF